MMKVSKPKPFSGKLLQPIRWTGPETPEFPPTIAMPQIPSEVQSSRRSAYQQTLQKCGMEFLERLALLREHYEIPPTSNWMSILACHLAVQFVPGCTTDYPQKGPRKWGMIENIQLVIDVDDIIAEKNCSDMEACRLLVKRKKRPIYLGKASTSNEGAARSLCSRLVEARHSPFLQIVKFKGWTKEQQLGALRDFLEIMQRK